MGSDTDTIFALLPADEDSRASSRYDAPASSLNRLGSAEAAPSRIETAAMRHYPPLLKPKPTRNCDPDQEYEWWLSLDLGNGRSYCYASSYKNDEAIMILRVDEKAVFEPERSEPYALRLIDAIAYNKSIYLVYPRPGVSLSRIRWRKRSAVQDFKTICKEVRKSGISDVD